MTGSIRAQFHVTSYGAAPLPDVSPSLSYNVANSRARHQSRAGLDLVPRLAPGAPDAHMGLSDRLLSLIELLYAAPGSEEGWRAFLAELRVALGGSLASIMSHRLDAPEGSIALDTHTDVEVIQEYQARWAAKDPWAAVARTRDLRGRAVVLGDELVPHAEIRRSPFYNEFGKRHDFARTAAGLVEVGPRALTLVSVNRGETAGSFEAPEVALLAALVPHIRQATQLHRRLVRAEGAASDFGAALDRSGRAVLLVDASGTVVHMNEAAQRLVALRDGLTVDRGRLRAARADDTARLRAVLGAALGTSKGDVVQRGGTLSLGRPSGRRALAVLVSPAPSRGEVARAIVFVGSDDIVAVPGEEELRTLYSFTPAEARLARLIGGGMSLTEAQQHLGIGRETVRTHLRAIFGKTATNRQADLVRLLLTGLPLP